MRPRVAVILLNWNGYADTSECIQSLQQQENIDVTIVVVDNASSDDSFAKLQAEFSQCVFIGRGDNGGFAKGNNSGIQWALAQRFPYIMLLNNDTVVPQGAISKMVMALADSPEHGAVSCRIMRHADPEAHWWRGGDIRFGVWPIAKGNGDTAVPKCQMEETKWLTGCVILASSDVWECAGLLDERFFMGVEDYAWSLRVRKCGWRLGVVNSAVIYHKVGRSTGEFNPQTFARFANYHLIVLAENNSGLKRAAKIFLFSCLCLLRGSAWAVKKRKPQLLRATLAGLGAFASRRICI